MAPLVAHSEPMREASLELKRFLRDQLYQHYQAARHSGGASLVESLAAIGGVVKVETASPATSEAAGERRRQEGAGGEPDVDVEVVGLARDEEVVGHADTRQALAQTVDVDGQRVVVDKTLVFP